MSEAVMWVAVVPAVVVAFVVTVRGVMDALVWLMGTGDD